MCFYHTENEAGNKLIWSFYFPKTSGTQQFLLLPMNFGQPVRKCLVTWENVPSESLSLLLSLSLVIPTKKHPKSQGKPHIEILWSQFNKGKWWTILGLISRHWATILPRKSGQWTHSFLPGFWLWPSAPGIAAMWAWLYSTISGCSATWHWEARIRWLHYCKMCACAL